ncbi:hypothetical protein GCM10014715_18730 [Streptomyces spiralis]|uniref:Uncharacterized protein n=1 Tax=Streptomyces spiralis TaxID=66376 RepID=A0A918ZRR7_9ACTN|nr:hypothetical protein [Streptomyces spiralis]GHE65381.1 hypothetical protein GCM10014715_18730 [Streptomyces spiralis]
MRRVRRGAQAAAVGEFTDQARLVLADAESRIARPDDRAAVRELGIRLLTTAAAAPPPAGPHPARKDDRRA